MFNGLDPLPNLRYVRPQRKELRTHPTFNETWIQDRIADDPGILGLGALILKDRERRQPRAGRLDLLLQDPETLRRYEVEVQLGATDEAHIVRTIEYWDLERKRYPQYEHCAVIVAEDISSRFLNVVSLFNGTIPLIAIQMQAMAIEDQVALVFTTVLDEMTRGLVDDDEEVATVTDRAYWEARGSKSTLGMSDEILKLIHELDQSLQFKYNKFYIGLARNGEPAQNFVTLKPRKSTLVFEAKIKQSDDVDKRIEESSLDTLEYDKRWGAYRLRLEKEAVRKHEALLRDLIKLAYDNWRS